MYVLTSKQNIQSYQQYNPLRQCFSQKKLISYTPTHTIGEYKYNENQQIGKGYSSKVYKAYHQKNKQQIYAIKVIDISKFKASSLEMLNNELEIHKCLKHQNIVQFYHSYKTDKFYYIVMEYCSKGDLMTYLIKNKKKIVEKSAFDIIRQIANGYKYLIKMNVLHRDLKPANIFYDGNKWKIGDFGFAVRGKSQFVDRVNVGTPLYMPLEALTKNKYSIKTDLFAVGVITYEILCGKTPWQCTTEKQLIKKMERMKLQIPIEIKSDKLKQLIVKGCEMDQNKRLNKGQFQSIDFNLHQNPQEGFYGILKDNFMAKAQDNNSRGKDHKDAYKQNAQKPKQQLHHSESTTTQSEPPQKKVEINLRSQLIATFKLNNSVLLSQLQFCRFIYYLIKNIESLLIKEKQNFKMLLFKHLLRIIKLLENRKYNPYNLKQWQLYRTSDSFHKINIQFKQYSLKYQRQYLQYLKEVNVNTIRTINKNFNELSQQGTNKILTQNCYLSLKKYLSVIMRNNNHQLGKLMIQTLTSKNNYQSYFEGMNSLYKYYQYVNLNIDKYNNYQQITKQSPITKICLEYKLSEIKYQDYQKLRIQCKNI